MILKFISELWLVPWTPGVLSNCLPVSHMLLSQAASIQSLQLKSEGSFFFNFSFPHPTYTCDPLGNTISSTFRRKSEPVYFYLRWHYQLWSGPLQQPPGSILSLLFSMSTFSCLEGDAMFASAAGEARLVEWSQITANTYTALTMF